MADSLTDVGLPPLAGLLGGEGWAAWHLPNALFGQSVAETATHFFATTWSRR